LQVSYITTVKIIQVFYQKMTLEWHALLKSDKVRV